jgi:tetratricopeptide (TPR) repeat protein
MTLFSRLLGNRRHTVALEESIAGKLVSGDIAAARALADEALSSSPGSAIVHQLNARVAIADVRMDAAVAHLRSAAAADPRSPQIRYELAEALRLANRPVEAIDAYQEALRGLPELSGALLGMGEALLDSGDRSGALECLQRAHSLRCEQKRADALKVRLAQDIAGLSPGASA